MELTNNEKKVITFIIKNPGSTFNQIAEGIGMSDSYIRKAVRLLEERGYVRYVNRYGYRGGPAKLWQANGRIAGATDQLNEAESDSSGQPQPSVDKSLAERKRELLKSLTPRELMLELRSRGYSGKLKYAQIIDIDNL